jgi:hypothetical protein
LHGRFEGFEIWRGEGGEPPRGGVGDGDLQPSASIRVEGAEVLTSKLLGDPRESNVSRQNVLSDSTISLRS